MFLLSKSIFCMGASRNYGRSAIGDDSPVFILFIFLCFGAGAIIRTLLRFLNVRLPYTVVLLFLGVIIGILSVQYESVHLYTDVSYIRGKYILIIFLPVIVFKTAYSMEPYTFIKTFWQIIIVSLPGLLMSIFFIGLIMMYVFEHHWSFQISILFGTIVAAINPYEAVLLLRELGHSKQLAILLEGESLLTNGLALIIFHILLQWITGELDSELHVLTYLTNYLLGGPLLGFIVGKIGALGFRYVFNDAITEITLTLVAVYVTYYVAEEILDVSGVLALLVLGVIFSAEKTSLNTEVENLLQHFWDILFYLINTLMFIVIGIVFAEECGKTSQLQDIIHVLITYIICVLSRLLMFIIFSPILSRIGHGLTWKNAVFAIWAGIRGAVNLCLCLIVIRTPKLQEVGIQFVLHTAALVMLTLLINASTVHLLLKFLGMSEISITKITNMTNAVRHLVIERDRAIGILKMNRFLADANWIVVEEGTRIKHPYKIVYEDDEDQDENYLDFRYTVCPDCQKEVLNEPTPKEWKEMYREAKLRILKAKKISYWRQFEHGMLSKEGVRVLVGAVETAIDKEDPVMDTSSITHTFTQRDFSAYMRRKLINIMTSTGPSYHRLPRQKWRRSYYKLATEKWFDYFILCTIILNSITIILELSMTPPFNLIFFIAMKVANSVFYAIYLTEFTLKIIAFGFIKYIKSHWNKLDTFILFMATADLLMDFLDIFTDFEKSATYTSTITTAAKLLRLFRLVKLFRLCRVFIPRVLLYIDTKLDVQLSQGYDIGKGFVTGEEEVLNTLPQLIDNQRIYEEMKQKLEEDRLTVTKALGLMQRDRAWIAITVKTRQAIRSVLNKLVDAMYELKEGGLLDDVEFLTLMDVIEERLKYLKIHLKTVEPCPPQVLLREVPWIVGDDKVAEYLLENSELINFNFAEHIVNYGDLPTELYILVSGLVKLSYLPNEMSLKKLRNEGALPNVDFFTSLQFEDKQEDYIVSGNVIGELGMLTGRCYDVKITCDTSVQAYKISRESMLEAMNLSQDFSHGLCSRMWKTIGVRMATVLLLDVPAYQSWSQEKIKLHLERAFVPILKSLKKFMVNNMVEDVILVEGQVMDANSKNIYIAPIYIPRTVHKLIFPGYGKEGTNPYLIPSLSDHVDKCSTTTMKMIQLRKNSSLMDVETDIEPKLLIIPAKDVDEYDVMENDNVLEMMPSSSSKCLQHIVRSNLSSQRSKARRGRGRRGRRNIYFYGEQMAKNGKDFSTRSSYIKKSTSRIHPSPSHSNSKEEERMGTLHMVDIPRNWRYNPFDTTIKNENDEQQSSMVLNTIGRRRGSNADNVRFELSSDKVIVTDQMSELSEVKEEDENAKPKNGESHS